MVLKSHGIPTILVVCSSITTVSRLGGQPYQVLNFRLSLSPFASFHLSIYPWADSSKFIFKPKKNKRNQILGKKGGSISCRRTVALRGLASEIEAQSFRAQAC